MISIEPYLISQFMKNDRSPYKLQIVYLFLK